MAPAQASDWPFILRAGTCRDYAIRRVQEHMVRFIVLHEPLTTTRMDEVWPQENDWLEKLVPNVDHRYLAGS